MDIMHLPNDVSTLKKIIHSQAVSYNTIQQNYTAMQQDYIHMQQGYTTIQHNYTDLVSAIAPPLSPAASEADSVVGASGPVLSRGVALAWLELPDSCVPS